MMPTISGLGRRLPAPPDGQHFGHRPIPGQLRVDEVGKGGSPSTGFRRLAAHRRVLAIDFEEELR
jgi:hypothetical protein